MIDENNWFFEANLPNCNNNFKVGIKIKKKLLQTKSQLQNIEIFDTVQFGRMLVLDGIVQTTENDHFVYHEMMTHLPMLSHSLPQNVLIIGGGDGGMLNEVLKYSIQTVTMVEIDEKVSEVSKQYLSSICENAFDDPRATVLFQDGKAFIESHKNEFDIIILDLSDPVGPAEQLITQDFYQSVKGALKPNGIISIQSGSLTWQPDEVKTISNRVSNIFKHVVVHKAVVPTYQGGEFSFTIASDIDLTSISERSIIQRYKAHNLKTKYYTPEKYHASAVLPKNLRETIGTQKYKRKWQTATILDRQIKHAPPTEPLGIHVTAEFWGTKNQINDEKLLEAVLIQAAKQANSSPLKIAIESFEPQGITGVLILAESHVSVHTWPERNYVAVDAFTCGAHTSPQKAIDYLEQAFQPEQVSRQEIMRGVKINASAIEKKNTEINL